MKFPRNAKLFRGQLDAAPFAGVFFLLVIFLLLHSTLVSIPGVRIQLPEASAKPSPGFVGPSAVVALDRTGRIYYQNQVVPEEKILRNRLREAVLRQPGLTLVVEADKGVSFEDMNRLSQAARDAGVPNVVWATRPPVIPARTVPGR